MKWKSHLNPRDHDDVVAGAQLLGQLALGGLEGLNALVALIHELFLQGGAELDVVELEIESLSQLDSFAGVHVVEEHEGADLAAGEGACPRDVGCDDLGADVVSRPLPPIMQAWILRFGATDALALGLELMHQWGVAHCESPFEATQGVLPARKANTCSVDPRLQPLGAGFQFNSRTRLEHRAVQHVTTASWRQQAQLCRCFRLPARRHQSRHDFERVVLDLAIDLSHHTRYHTVHSAQPLERSEGEIDLELLTGVNLDEVEPPLMRRRRRPGIVPVVEAVQVGVGHLDGQPCSLVREDRRPPAGGVAIPGFAARLGPRWVEGE